MPAAAHTAGIALHRVQDGVDEVLLVHPGGPFWAGKDEHAWSVPKGEFDPSAEAPIDAAAREFTEELGHPPPETDRSRWRELPSFRAGRKTLHCWLVDGDFDTTTIASNEFEMEWPPRSGSTARFPEVDAARWFPIEVAATKLHKGQRPLCELILDALGN
ncbi:MAG: NUDIX domain-containing protein [Actinomycetota bacterium]